MDIDTLRPGLECDLTDLAARYVAVAPSWALDNPSDIHKTAIGRVSDALTPSLLGLIRDVRDGRVAIPEGVVARFVPFPTPWKMGLGIELPGEQGFLFSVDLRVPFERSATALAGRRVREDAKRAEYASQGLTGEALEREVISSVLVDEIMDEESAVATGSLPDDLPSPDEADEIEETRLTRYGLSPASAVAPQGPEGLAAWAAAVRPCLGKSLDQVVAAAAVGGHLVRDMQVFETTPSREPYRDDAPSWSPGNVELGDPVGWMRGLAALRPLLVSSGRLADVEAAAREVGARRYVTYSDDHGLIEDEMGQALALMEGGLPGMGALRAMAEFEAGIAAMAVALRMADAARLAEGLRDRADALEDGRFVYNDLDNSAAVEVVDGAEVLTLTDQNGQFVVALRRDSAGEVDAVSLARYGLPLEEYLDRRWRKGAVTLEEVGYGDFHRDHANPLDPGAPLGREEAVAAVVAAAEGMDAFPGFLGAYEMRDSRLACVAPAGFDLRNMRDLNTIKSCIESGAIRFDRDVGPGPGP